MPKEATNAAVSHITVALAVTGIDSFDGSESDILVFSSTYETSGDVHRLAENALVAMCREVTGHKNGWAHRDSSLDQAAGFSGASVTMSVNIADGRTKTLQSDRTFTVKVDTNAGLVNAIDQATMTVTDDAQAWVTDRKWMLNNKDAKRAA